MIDTTSHSISKLFFNVIFIWKYLHDKLFNKHVIKHNKNNVEEKKQF